MKKLFIAVLMSLMLTSTAFAACQPIWDKVAGHTFTIQDLVVVFSEAYAGPCPQGEVEIFQDGQSLGTLHYMTKGENEVVIGDDLEFVVVGNDLVYVTLVLEAE